MVVFNQRIIQWHAQSGRHDLPWQRNPTPYRVWVSEIMLQQTQVATVIPYYQRFMRRFPSVKKLALAAEDDVLSYWSGLGYYARARHLHRAAKTVHHDLRGRFPRDIEQLQALPGIGRSTAGAIRSLAYQQFAVILDGNVKRVLARHAAIAGWSGNKKTHDELWQYATDLTPKINANTYNQAMMDIGATLCTRTRPQCTQCPVNEDCQAYRDETQHLYPGKKSAPTRRPHKSTAFLLIRSSTNPDHYLLEKRPASGIWGGLWCFPQATDHSDALAAWQQEHNLDLNMIKTLPSFRHVFSHFDLTIEPIVLTCDNLNENDTFSVVDIQSGKLPGGIPAPVNRLIQQLQQEA